MSGTAPQPAPPPSAAPPGAPPALAGATAGMQAPQQVTPMQMKFRQLIGGAREVIAELSRTPGVDQQKLQQAVQMLTQGLQLLAQAIGHQPSQ